MGQRGDALIRAMKPLLMPVVLVKPNIAVSTADAYRAFDRAPLPMGDMRGVTGALRTQDAKALGASLSNNMTAASSSLVSEIAEILSWLNAEEDVLGAAMAGSGSAVFGLCPDPAVAERLVLGATERGWWSEASETSDRGPTVTEGGDVA